MRLGTPCDDVMELAEPVHDKFPGDKDGSRPASPIAIGYPL